MKFSDLLNYIYYNSGLPRDFRLVFLVDRFITPDFCFLHELLNSDFYKERYFVHASNYDLIQFTFIADEIIFILKEI